MSDKWILNINLAANVTVNNRKRVSERERKWSKIEENAIKNAIESILKRSEAAKITLPLSDLNVEFFTRFQYIHYFIIFISISSSHYSVESNSLISSNIPKQRIFFVVKIEQNVMFWHAYMRWLCGYFWKSTSSFFLRFSFFLRLLRFRSRFCSLWVSVALSEAITYIVLIWPLKYFIAHLCSRIVNSDPVSHTLS